MSLNSAMLAGVSGLAANSAALAAISQNIANVNTPGYTRQRVEITADAGPVTPAIHSTWDGAGLGVRSAEVLRLRDALIDRRKKVEAAPMR